MKKIRNLSKKPVVVPLPQGKKLHLGLNKTGEISDHAVDHPPLLELVDDGAIEIVGDGGKHDDAAARTPGVHEAPQGQNVEIASHHRGER